VSLSRIAAKGIDLAKSLYSGQVFHWTQHGKGFVGAIDQKPCYLEQCGTQLLVSRYLISEARRYLALDHGIDEIHRTQRFVTRPGSEFCANRFGNALPLF